MITTAIIFSRNRAMQLDALLASIELYAPTVFDELIVLYRADHDHAMSYRLLRQERVCFDGAVNQIRYLERAEGGLPVDFYSAMHFVLDHRLRTQQLVFFSDDCMFYRRHNTRVDLHALDAFCYAFRLGNNVNYCYPINQPQGPGEHDFNYALTIDGHVYRADDIIRRIKALPYFNSPTQMEDRLQDGQRYKIAYPEHSVMVNVPNNLVQTSYPNRNGGGSVATLLSRYLEGYRIDIQAMDFSNVNACHQEIPFVFVQEWPSCLKA